MILEEILLHFYTGLNFTSCDVLSIYNFLIYQMRIDGTLQFSRSIFFSLQFINHLNKNNDVFVCSMLLFTAYKTIIHSYDALYYKSIDYTALLHTCKFLFMPIHSSCKIMSTTTEIRKSEFLD